MPEYYAPREIKEVLSLLEMQGAGAILVAGGTDVLVAMRAGLLSPSAIIALHKIPELHGITINDGIIAMGAMTTFSAIAESSLIREQAFLLAQAANAVGSPQIRNRGTVGGNIVNASPAADTVPALMALDAKVKLVSVKGTREVLLENFFSGGANPKSPKVKCCKKFRFRL